MNKLELLRLFCSAAEVSNFKEAARLQAVSPQTVTRAVQQLEQLTGELLFHRNTRQVRLTQFGEQLAEQGRQQLEQLDKLLRPISQPKEQASGVVRLTAPHAFREVLLPLLSEFCCQYPEIRLDLRFADQHSALVDEQIDLGLRIGVLRDQSFVAAEVGVMSLLLVASPAYLAAQGQPDSQAALAQHRFTGLLDEATGRPWLFYTEQDKVWQPPAIHWLANDAFSELHGCLAGIGISQQPYFLLAPYLADGRLVRLLPELEPAPWPVSLYRPQRGPVPLRIRLLFDFLRSRLSAHPMLRPA